MKPPDGPEGCGRCEGGVVLGGGCIGDQFIEYPITRRGANHSIHYLRYGPTVQDIFESFGHLYNALNYFDDYYIHRARHVVPTPEMGGWMAGAREHARQYVSLVQAVIVAMQDSEIQYDQERLDKRIRVFDIIGKSCVCCGESNALHLQLDHINNDGKLHRGFDLYAAVLREPESWRDVLQTMCATCNIAKHRYGRCPPHEKKTEREEE